MNTVVLIGRLARDPELRYTPSGSAIANITLAIDRPTQQGQEKQADFIRVTIFGKQAESASRYLSKGRQAAIHGRIQTGSYKDSDGKTVYTTDVIADRVEFLGDRQGSAESRGYEDYKRSGQPAGERGGYPGYMRPSVDDVFAATNEKTPFD